MAMARKTSVDAVPEFPEQMIYDTELPAITPAIQGYLDLCHEMKSSELKVDDPSYSEFMGKLDAAWEAMTDDEKRVADRVIAEEAQTKQATEVETSPDASPAPIPVDDDVADTDAPPAPEGEIEVIDEEIADSDDLDTDEPGVEEK